MNFDVLLPEYEMKSRFKIQKINFHMIQFLCSIQSRFRHIYKIIPQRLQMYGLTTSQSIFTITILATLVLYFAANTPMKQNVWIFFFGVAITLLVVDFLFMNERTFEYEPHYENWQKRREMEDNM